MNHVMQRVRRWQAQYPAHWRYGRVALGCLLIVIAIDLVTNDLNRERYYWDFALYIDMAENGLVGNDELIAPFVYRFLTPLGAGALADLFDISVIAGFKVIAYVGGVAQLFMVYVLAEAFGASGGQAWTVLGVVALSLYNLKFLIFDVTRPDHLAYPLMVVQVLAVFRRRLWVLAVVSCVGMLIREFLIIPPAIMVALLGLEFLKTRRRQAAFAALGLMAAVGVFVIVPRVVIPIQVSGQYLDPVNNPDSWDVLLDAPRSARRVFNLLFNLASFMLPLALLLTWGRVRRTWDALRGYRLYLGLHTLLVLVMALYGGTDLWRFMTFMFVPLAIVLAVLLRENRVSWLEIAYMLAVVGAYNRILLDVPNWIEPYLDFYSGYDTRVNFFTKARVAEMGFYLAGIWVLRGGLYVRRQAARDTARAPYARREVHLDRTG